MLFESSSANISRSTESNHALSSKKSRMSQYRSHPQQNEVFDKHKHQFYMININFIRVPTEQQTH